MKSYLRKLVALSGFEPESPAPKASMIDHYTTGLLFLLYAIHLFKALPTKYVDAHPVTSTSMKIPSGISPFMAIGL